MQNIGPTVHTHPRQNKALNQVTEMPKRTRMFTYHMTMSSNINFDFIQSHFQANNFFFNIFHDLNILIYEDFIVSMFPNTPNTSCPKKQLASYMTFTLYLSSFQFGPRHYEDLKNTPI